MLFFAIVSVAAFAPSPSPAYDDEWSWRYLEVEPTFMDEEFGSDPGSGSGSGSGPDPASGENNDNSGNKLWLYVMIGSGAALFLSALVCGYYFHRHFRHRSERSLTEEFIPTQSSE